MATGCYGGARRLSELLQEEQEPFLQPPQRRSPVEALLCGGYEAARKALRRWDLPGCFRCGARAGDIADAVGGGRQLSPVSVLELHSDGNESPELSHESWDDDDKPSTSPPSDHDHRLPTPCSTFFVTTNGKIRAMEAQVEGIDSKRRKSSREAMGRATISGWERIAADISRIPTLVALDLSRSAREWSRLVAAGEEEARRVGHSIEAIIFEELRWEAVRDMVCLPRHF
ncbi:unnamed protein product [Urochloa humidicola]